jgi:hypothetical protein
MNDKLQIIAQASGYKNLKIEGGFRLQLDIFESRDQDIAMCALLVNKRANLKLTIEPLEEKNV